MIKDYFLNIKGKIKQITPPIIWSYLSKKLREKEETKKNYDPRRYWSGEDLDGDNVRFGEIFKNIDLKTSICIINKEIRDCLILAPKKKIKLKFINYNKDKEVLFSLGNKFDGRSIKGNYQIYFDGIKKLEILEPLSSRWNNAFYKTDSIVQEIEVINNTEENLYFACPIFLKKFKHSKDNDLKNIFLIVLDQVDYATLKEVEKKPNSLKYMSDFFSRGINYENCFSAAEWTLPCLSSIFSGKHPSYHGNFDLKYSKKIKNVITDNNLIDFLRKQEFSTFGISRSKGHHASFNFQSYFDRLFYYDDIEDVTIEDDYIFVKKVIEQLEANQDGKNFIYLHFMSSHSPYWKPGINEEKNLNLFRYGDSQKEYEDAIIGMGDSKVEPIMDEEKLKSIQLRQKERIKNLDLVLGQLFSYLEKKDYTKNSLVFFTADHGPNHFGKKNFPMMNRPRLNVPMKIYDYKNLNYQSVDEYICHTDLFPLIKSLVLKKDLENLAAPYGKKKSPVISESIFNDKYKASIRSKEHTFHFSCKFDPINSKILLNKPLDNRIEFHNSIKEDENRYKKIYFTIMVEHLKKSKILNIIL